MKKYRYFLITAVLALAIGCGEEGRLDQPDNSTYVPEQVTILGAKSIPGGSIIRYTLPNDDNLRGVKVVYERNGEICECVSSRYVDSLRIEGFGDTEEHSAQVFSIGFNDKLSEPVDVTFKPETPTIKTVKTEISEVFGGVQVHLTGNENGDDLAVVLIVDTLLTDEGKKPSEMEWSDITTFHTSQADILLKQRGMEAEPKLFGAYIRDRWGNCSDTSYFKVTPLEEYELPRVNQWQIYTLPGDETKQREYPSSNYLFPHLFDGAWNANNKAIAYQNGGRDRWITIDMGYVAKFSRHRLLQRSNVKKVDNDWNPWRWQIWGSMDPNPDGSYDDSWYLLGDFTQYKPSGILPDGSGYGTFTEEDTDWIRNVNEYDFVENEQTPDAFRPCRYVRLRFRENYVSAFSIYDEEPTNIGYFIGELILYGTIIETTE